MKNSLLIVSLIAPILFGCSKKGCMDPNAINYDPHASADNGKCEMFSPSQVKDVGYVSIKDYTEGLLSTDTIFFKKIPGAEIDYLVNYTVDFSNVVVIEPGVKFAIEKEAKIIFNRNVYAEGTSDNWIEFVPVSLYWRGISIFQYSGPSAFDAHFDYVRIRGAKSSTGGFAMYVNGQGIGDISLRYTNSRVEGNGLSCAIRNLLPPYFDKTGSVFIGADSPEC